MLTREQGSLAQALITMHGLASPYNYAIFHDALQQTASWLFDQSQQEWMHRRYPSWGLQTHVWKAADGLQDAVRVEQPSYRLGEYQMAAPTYIIMPSRFSDFRVRLDQEMQRFHRMTSSSEQNSSTTSSTTLIGAWTIVEDVLG